MKRVVYLSAVSLLVGLGCGPSISDGGGDDEGSTDGGGINDVDSGGDDCTAAEGFCFDNIDNDCDGKRDCEDPDCASLCNPGGDAGVECGEAAYSGGTLAIPDGVGLSYETVMDIQGFEPGQTLLAVDGFVAVCVNMEHSWLRDLQMEMLCPSGALVVLNEFLGTIGGEVYMGVPNDSDSYDPIPGTGMQYCWTPTATNLPMLDWANANPTLSGTLPAGDYQASGTEDNPAPNGFDPLVGCILNGDWTIRVTDDWGIDNGFIFDWTLEFNPEIIEDCENWPIP